MQRFISRACLEQVRRLVSASWLTAFTVYGAAAQSITWIELPSDARYGPTTGFFANGGGLSEDGTVLVQASDQPVAYYWKAGTGWVQVGDFGYNLADVSSDGRILVGISPLDNIYAQPAYYDSQIGSWHSLGLPAGVHAYAISCSQDGTLIVGAYSLGNRQQRPFRWQGGTYTLLPIPPGTNADAIYAVGVSPDGSVAVGCTYFEDRNGGLPDDALRWDGDQLTVLPKLHPQGSAWAVDASLQGQVIVGGGINPSSNSFEAVRWNSNNIQSLPKGEFIHAIASTVTRTGQVVTGAAWDNETGSAVRWSACGFEKLEETYAGLLGSGEHLLTAHLLTQSGRYIAGFGNRNGTGVMYILDTGKCWDPAGNVDANCCVDDTDLLLVLFDFGRQESGLATDLNCDGIVDDADLLIVLFNFGQGC